ncbi:MAG: hypothetical protein WEH44_03960 [Pirellulaceae bacterium]
MPPLTFYIETSVWGSLAPRQPRDRRQIVQRLVRLLDGIRGQAVISQAVIAEIENAPPRVRNPLRQQLQKVQPTVLPVTDEIEELVRAYIESKVLPPRRETDGIHVASATCFELDYLVSWNHRH